MKFKAMMISAAIAAASLTAANAHADVLTVGGGWDPFSFGDVGSSFSTDFSFVLTSTATFNVTDAFLDGDQFDITINDVDQGPTSTPTNDGTQVNDDYDAAFASPLFSHGSYTLGAGTYDVTGTVVLSPFGSGGAAAELVASAAPEPSIWALMIAGLGLVGFALRLGRRREAVITA